MIYSNPPNVTAVINVINQLQPSDSTWRTQAALPSKIPLNTTVYSISTSKTTPKLTHDINHYWSSIIT